MAGSLHNPNYQLFASLLKGTRLNAGLTQTDVATRLGRPQSYIAKIEGLERRIDMVEFIELARAMGKDPLELLSDYLSAVEPSVR